MAYRTMKDLFWLLLLGLCLGCVNLDQPKAVAQCSANHSCSDQPQTGGVSGSGLEAGSEVGGESDVALGSADATGSGGIGAASGGAGSGGQVGSGGTIALDGALGAGGIAGLADGSAGAGGNAGSGGAMTGGASGISDGATIDALASNRDVPGSGGIVSVDVAMGSGGALGSGGVLGSGGIASLGGSIGTGGSAGAGGAGGAGGSTSTGCGTVTSTFSETFSFATGLGSLNLVSNSASGARLVHVTSGPAANSALCSPSSGCAALSLAFASGAAAYTAFALAAENFAPTIDLVGAKVTFSLVVDNPGTTQVPIQIQAYAQGDASANYAWTQPATLGGATLQSYAATTGFKDLVLSVANNTSTTGNYCAAVTGAIGIQLQNAADITSSNAGTVTVYIAKITISPP